MDLKNLGLQFKTDSKTEAILAINEHKNKQNFQKLELTRQLLEKPSEVRTLSDIEELALLIKDNKFFKDRGELTYQDIKDLAANFEFLEVEQYDDVVKYGDVGDLFYMIIKGSVSVQIPNPEIKKWDIFRKEYLRLKQWKWEDFDPKARRAKKEAEARYTVVATEKCKIIDKIASKIRLDLISQANNNNSSNKSIGSVISPVKIRQSTMKMPHLFKQTTKDVTAIILGNVNRQSSRSMAAFGVPEEKAFVFDPRKHMDMTKQELENLKDFERLDKLKWFKEVAKLMPGHTFGELALINKAPRSATIYCQIDSWFATLNK